MQVRQPAIGITAARLSSPNAKEKQIHDQGLVTVLRQIHDELDEAVLEAYGWSDHHKERGRLAHGGRE